MNRITLLLLVAALAGCASPRPKTHGKITTLSAASTKKYKACEHKVPEEVCTRCNPHLEPKFKKAKDWCPEHGIPESQCFECHPNLTFDPLPQLREGVDLVEISEQGEDVPTLEPHIARGKITIFDFYAVWCASCREIDAHVFGLLNKRADIAVRKLNVVSWETPVAKRYLKNVPGLPYLIVFNKRGKQIKEIMGLNLKALDAAIKQAESI